ncbi:MAG: hypothetical protein PHC86_05430 [Eubacteriales bacterium]|nr:hypothetical protein [Eubacteriales bacterium]
MARIPRDTMQLLWNESVYPSISIYLPILREGNEVNQTPIRLNTILEKVEDHLRREKLTANEIKAILSPAAELLDAPLFWAYAHEGLAIFISANSSFVMSLDHAVQEQVVIDNHFVTRQLLEIDSADAEYLLLAIGRSGVRVYRGSRNRLILIPVSDLPDSLESIVSTYSFEKQRQQYGGSAGAVNHGFDNRKDRDHIMLEEYLRQIDTKVLAHWRSENLPTVVACVDYLFATFRKVSKNPYLMPENISGSPDHLTEIELNRAAWRVVSAQLPDGQAKDWELAQNHLGSERIRENIRQIIDVAERGRVAQLFIPKDHIIAGRIEPHSHKIVHQENSPENQHFSHTDLLEIAAIKTLQNGGQVYTVAHEQLPKDADALAMLRY